SVREAERAARWAGARRKPRRSSRTPSDPVLADRARAAAELLTGRFAQVRSGRLEILFADDVELAEIVETLEAAVSPD
ncbi:MAG TPA: hypothetical protein VFT18_05995, partial [Gaiellaceae bacterium]|nr:hypothetical protein [Gaiellaceae bacterium]